MIDDGRGSADELRQGCRGPPGHLGLAGMRERAPVIGAVIDIEKLDEGGTCVVLKWPRMQAS